MSRQTISIRQTSEKSILEDYVRGNESLQTRIEVVSKPKFRGENPINQNIIGYYRKAISAKNIVVDTELIKQIQDNNKLIPFFYEAGPRKSLSFDPKSVRAAIVTTGGIAPGLHSVIHAIVQRHRNVYKMDFEEGGRLYGIPDGFKGFCRENQKFGELETKETENWLALGGTELGSVRFYGGEIPTEETQIDLANKIAQRLRDEDIDILYVLGGDGSMRTAHKIAKIVPEKSIACVPKTMDNDILWVWESFGFSSAVEKATEIINTLHREAVSTRRISLIELFGAESGFVAANASIASGQVNLVLIPEVFKLLKEDRDKDNPQYHSEAIQSYITDCINHIKKIILQNEKDPHVVVVIAQGVSNYIKQISFHADGGEKRYSNTIQLLTDSLKEKCKNCHDEDVEVFVNEPKHNIRAIPANSRDQIYCERLGALVVDNALAGYTDFMVSQWQTEYVLVPLELATKGQKSIPLEGMFWKQVTNLTGQPTHEEYLIENKN